MKRIFMNAMLATFVLSAPGSTVLAQDLPTQIADSLDSTFRHVVSFLAHDSTVQTAPTAAQQFLLVEKAGESLRIVARASSKVDLYVLGRASGEMVVSGLFPSGIVAASRVEYYVYRSAERG